MPNKTRDHSAKLVDLHTFGFIVPPATAAIMVAEFTEWLLENATSGSTEFLLGCNPIIIVTIHDTAEAVAFKLRFSDAFVEAVTFTDTAEAVAFKLRFSEAWEGDQ